MMQRPFSEWLAAARQGRKWTVDQVASKSGLSKTHVYALERGITEPTFAVGQQVASAFGIKLSEIVAWLED